MRRYRALLGMDKKQTVTVTALAPELSGFVWTIGKDKQRRSRHSQMCPAHKDGGMAPALRQGTPQTHIRNCGNQLVHRSLITDVYRSLLRPCALSSTGH